MVTIKERPIVNPAPVIVTPAVTRITVFHCINALDSMAIPEQNNCSISIVKMPCSGMTSEVYLLKAFEAGADAVVVLVCPEGSCRYMEGSIRARKRVTSVKQLLDEIGLDGRRLQILNISHGDERVLEYIIKQTCSSLAELGPSPAI